LHPLKRRSDFSCRASMECWIQSTQTLNRKSKGGMALKEFLARENMAICIREAPMVGAGRTRTSGPI
jgi:hypothetical protein